MHQKNHPFLVDIFNEIHKKRADVVLLLVGIGELQKEIQEKVKKLKLEEFVIFAYQSQDTSRYYQAMDAFVLPSFYEGLPVVGLEAQANGLPCYFSDSMTTEVALLTTTKIIGLNESAEIWADKISFANRTNSELSTEKIRNSGYDISVEALKLQAKYMQLLSNDEV